MCNIRSSIPPTASSVSPPAAEETVKRTPLTAWRVHRADFKYARAVFRRKVWWARGGPNDSPFCFVPSSTVKFTITPQFPNKTSWQPLMESDELGYIFTQEHVVSHIGATARFYGLNSTVDEKAFASRQLSLPNDKYMGHEQGVGIDD